MKIIDTINYSNINGNYTIFLSEAENISRMPGNLYRKIETTYDVSLGKPKSILIHFIDENSPILFTIG